MEHGRKNILIAVDGSERSFEVVRYVGHMLSGTQARVTLFHVLDPVSDNVEEVRSGLEFRQRILGVDSWEVHQKRMLEDFMYRARQLLKEIGYSEDDVSVLVKEIEIGVARDISEESQYGYDALVVGRRGMSEVKELIMGSTANKLVSCLSHIPIWVVGGRPDPDKILIAIDSSEGTMRALDHLGDLLGGAHPQLLLLHVIRGFDVFEPGYEQCFIPQGEKDWLEKARTEFKKAEREMEAVFAECTRRLERKGAGAKRIKTKITIGGYSRALSIVGEALEGGYGTIVVGRRGLSRVEDFFMGRVSNKVLQLAREMAVWVVH